MIKEMELDKFEEDIAQGPVLLFFYSKTCGPCKMLTFIIDGIDKKIGDKFTVLRVDFEENEDLVKKYDVGGFPTLVMLKDGEEASRKAGLQQKPIIERLINEAI